MPQSILNHQGIFLSGYFEYPTSSQNAQYLIPDTYREYTLCRKPDETEKYKEHLKGKYYENWFNAIYPQNTNHFITKEPLNFPLAEATGVSGAILENIHVYVFEKDDTSKACIYSLHIHVGNDKTLDDIQAIIQNLRQILPDSSDVQNPLYNIIREKIIVPFNGNQDWQKFSPNLKLYLNIDLNTDIEDKELNNLLIDLATSQPLRYTNKASRSAFSDSYTQHLINNNLINVFDSWRAICLYDSFVRISVKEIDNTPQANQTIRIWEKDYYTIYIYSFYIRFRLYRMSEAISLISTNRDSRIKARKQYTSFVNTFDLPQISYKFLPNIIYKKMIAAFEIDKEIKILEKKFITIHDSEQLEFERELRNVEHSQHSRAKRMELMLLIFSIVSVTLHGTELFEYAFFPVHDAEAHYHQDMFRTTAGIILGLLILLTLYSYYSKKKANHESN